MSFLFGLYLLGIFIGLGCVLPGISTAQLGTNNNGLSDVWEDIFSPVPVPVPLSSDVDADTLNTLQQCIAETDPQNAASVHRVSEIFDVNSVSLSLAFVSPEFASNNNCFPPLLLPPQRPHLS